MPRTLHPTMVARAAAVKQAHAELSKTPGFRALPPIEQFKKTQQALKSRKI